MSEESKKYGRPWPTEWQMKHIGGPQYQAMKDDEENSMEFAPIWAENGWTPKQSATLRDVLFRQEGRFSDTIRIVMGPDRLLLEIFFPWTDEPPRIVAHYKGRLPSGFYGEMLESVG